METSNWHKPEGGKLKKFLLGKGAESECPFHKLNYRVYEGVAGLFRKKEPIAEEPKGHDER